MTEFADHDADTARTDRMAMLLRLLESDPGNLALLADTAEAALDAHEAQIAGDLLDRYAAITPLPPREANLAGLAALQAKRFDRAAEIFSRLVADGAKDSAVRFNLAWARANLKEFEAALEILDDDSARDLAQAAMLRVQLLHEVGDFDAAGEVARDYITLHPDHHGLMAAVSVLALDIDDEALAEACAAKAGAHPDALTTKGTLALGHERATEAVFLFDLALAANPSLPRAWIGLGLAKLMTGESASAAADIDHGAELFGDHLGSWIAAGWAYFVAGDTITSRARFEAAMALDATFAETHGSLAVLDLLGGDIAEATRKSDIALRLDRKCYSAALAKSLIAASGGDQVTARRIFDHAARTPIGESGRTIGQALAKMGLGAG
ncbi:tetratricopeptide repeat protein [Sphingomonas sp. So64.6b]|uniref:tetratricopeptide repeat protein n=1 Tax=Sphingomonas sp. So64.6b TaxID=2997354 RepID=UPI0015FF5ED7|nr:tetratricopeptide repeat protein [Sphingomonas sp. So64.6b]QNA82943.1 tetratricopeptide repeat protein [Sphingomonas sp. So64.6b]